MQFERQPAIPCTLVEIAKGPIDTQGVTISRGVVSRASVIGVITSITEAGTILEDGTSHILLRPSEFSPIPIMPRVGEIVVVIGKPREYSGQRYLQMEICKRLRNPAWVEYRRRELALLVPREPTVKADTTNPKRAVLERIKQLDEGTGADIELLISEIPQAEGVITALLTQGDIFEIRPGKLKVLE